MLELFRLCFDQQPRRMILVILLSVAAATAQATALFFITRTAELARETPNPLWFYGFLSFLALFSVCKWYALSLSVRLTTLVAAELRTQFNVKLAAAELIILEQIGKDRLFEAITRQINIISSSLWFAVLVVQNLSLIVTCLLYIAILSPIAMTVTLLIFGLAVLSFQQLSPEQKQAFSYSEAASEGFFALARQLVDGFKELKLHPHRRRALAEEHLFAAANDARQKRLEATLLYAEGIMLRSTWVYILFGIIAFVLPEFNVVRGLATVLSAVLYLFDRLIVIITLLPSLSRAGFALDELHSLEADLGRDVLPPALARQQFRSLRLERVTFSYGEAFTLGPLDLSLKQGEILFIVGGNGSGKSTLLKVLTGLYPPSSGTVLLDGQPVTPNQYRGLFTAVFTEFHLFDQLYGIETIDHRQVQVLLNRLDIAHKTRLENRCFSHTRLSTGQRKRLALVAALLEKRPIIVFDEWTADQDPEFRAFFYQELLPMLQNQGKTLISVTHDDRYFHHADRCITLEYGQLHP